MENNELYKKAFDLIKSSHKVLVSTHGNPDGDAISSLCIIVDLLENTGKEYVAFCEDEIPFQYSFLPHIEKINNNKDEIVFSSFDLIILVDCGAIWRSGLAELLDKKDSQILINFDHHIKIEDFYDLDLRNDKAASTTEVIYKFYKENNIKINKEVANSILTGILTDTANFLYPVASEQTMEIASEMLISGAKISMITEHTWRNKSLKAMRFWGKAMVNIKVNPEFNIAYTIITYEDIQANNISENDLEGLVNFLGNLHGVKGVLLLKEGQGIIKGSLRTADSDLDLSKLANILGGGGHKKSSGFLLKGTLEKKCDSWEVR